MPNNLLDTHTSIWFVDGSKELSDTAKQAIEASDTTNFISIASLWEIAIKISPGKLELKTRFEEVTRQITENGFQILPVTFADTLTLSTLPYHHRDPFDRMLIAQAITNHLMILSKDDHFTSYISTVIW